MAKDKPCSAYVSSAWSVECFKEHPNVTSSGLSHDSLDFEGRSPHDNSLAPILFHFSRCLQDLSPLPGLTSPLRPPCSVPNPTLAQLPSQHQALAPNMWRDVCQNSWKKLKVTKCTTISAVRAGLASISCCQHFPSQPGESRTEPHRRGGGPRSAEEAGGHLERQKASCHQHRPDLPAC